MDEQEFMRQEHCAHIRQTHLIEDLLRCGGLPGREVGVILVVALAERSGAGWLLVAVQSQIDQRILMCFDWLLLHSTSK